MSRLAKEAIVHAVYLIRVTHADDSVTRLSSGYRNVDWDDGSGETVWQGTGGVVSCELPEVGDGLAVTEFTLALSGVSGDFAWMAGEAVRNLPVSIWLAFLDAQGRVAEAVIVEEGLQQRVEWEESDSGETTLSLICQSGVPFLQTQVTPRWSPEPHAAWLASLGEDPDSDTGFDRQASIPDDAAGAAWFRPL